MWTIGLDHNRIFGSQCTGGNSQYETIARYSELFENIKCMCSPLLPSVSAIFQAFSELQGVSQYQELVDLELLKMGAFPAADMTPQLFASAISMPNLMEEGVRNIVHLAIRGLKARSAESQAA